MLSSISEVDEEWMNNDIMAMAPTDESALQPDEVALRSRLRRGTTEDLISSLHSLKPNSVADNRSVEVGILNEVLFLFQLLWFNIIVADAGFLEANTEDKYSPSLVGYQQSGTTE